VTVLKKWKMVNVWYILQRWRHRVDSVLCVPCVDNVPWLIGHGLHCRYCIKTTKPVLIFFFNCEFKQNCENIKSVRIAIVNLRLYYIWYIHRRSKLTTIQARSQDCQNEEADRSSAPSPPLPFPHLRSKSSYGVWGSAVSSRSGVWGGAPAEIDFGALQP